jgi:hypothetical protein
VATVKPNLLRRDLHARGLSPLQRSAHDEREHPEVARELKAAGFEIVSSTTEDRAVKVVARRPT